MVYKDDEEYDSVFQIKTTPAQNFKDKVKFNPKLEYLS